jgi:transcriptional regulator with XRE-family HTH domain
MTTDVLPPLSPAVHEEIGRLVAEARRARELSQAQVGRLLGWPQSRVANVELGRRRLLFIEALLLARVLDVPLSALQPPLAEAAAH